MTNAQLYFAVGLPIIAVLTALVISLVQISGIRDDIRDLRGDLRSLVTKLDLLTGKVAEIVTRLSVIEERLQR